ncbi:aspergillopepsin [Teratosphaeria destructans]|uniref:Aspergillopepsin n=1 Tax=Teratosphaeria destructans TaxID=418781 RepID=A0A9W7W6Z9_9PEZI|nr:aspergillopepsin [Teratosphaeria destructans]
MRVTSVVGAMLLACTAIAAPSKLSEKRAARRAERMSRRASGHAKSLRPLAVNATSLNDFVQLQSTNDAHVEYSSNWAGAVVISSGITEVTGKFTVPTPSTPSSGSSREEYAASAWVGIDGDTCESAILQTGVDFLVEGSEVAFDAWYEWYPDYAYDFDIDISAGDVIVATVKATSKTAGSATIENETTGKSVTHTFTNSADLGTLCETDAEWIVEDFESGNELVAFADFGTVTFTDAKYIKSGSTYSVTSSATIIDIEQDEVLTSVSVPSSGEVVVKYE